MAEIPRKLAEIWEVGQDYHLRVIIGAFQRGLTADPAQAEALATYEVVEVLREIVRNADANRVELAADERLPPPEDE